MKHCFSIKLFLLSGFILFIYGCQKDDYLNFEEETQIESIKAFNISAREIPSHILDYVKQKTNNTFRVSIGKKSMKLSDSGINELNRDTPLGIVQTNKVVQVYNERNIKYTFKVNNPIKADSAINLVVVDMEGDIIEYFIEYVFDPENPSPRLESGAIDMSRFTGVMFFYNMEGAEIGNFIMNDGEMIDYYGEMDPCEEDDVVNEENDDSEEDDNDSSGTGGGPIDDSSNTNEDDNNSNGSGSGSGSGWYEDVEQQPCGMDFYYGNCGCGGEDITTMDGHRPSNRQCCNGTPLIAVDTCTGQTWHQSGKSITGGTSPCDGDVGVLINDDDDDCDTSKEDLKKIFPDASDTDLQTLASVINDKGEDFGIDSKEKLQHFLAQAGHEVGGFDDGIGVEESLYYTTASRLKTVYKKYFRQSSADTLGTKREADSTYLRNSSKVANYVYCCRMGNGNEASGDGYKYRGRGIFQLTGKTNYTNFKTWYNDKYDPDKDFVSNPNQLKDNDTMAIMSALWFYKTSVLDKITVDSTATVKSVTKKINGGTNGLADRKEIFKKAKDSIDCN